MGQIWERERVAARTNGFWGQIAISLRSEAKHPKGGPKARGICALTPKTPLKGAHFLWLVFQRVLPKGFRRSRNFGLAHPNCKHRQRLMLLRMGLKPSAKAHCTPGMPPSTQPPLSERPKLQCRCCG